MGITYRKMLALFKEKGITTTKIREDKIIGQKTLSNIKNNKGIDTKTLGKICKLLDCQPGELMEYIPDDDDDDDDE